MPLKSPKVYSTKKHTVDSMSNNTNTKIFTTLGASNHSAGERESNDFYATDPEAAELLLQIENFEGDIWECAAGENHLADVFRQHGYEVRTSDLIARTEDVEVLDFLSCNKPWHGNIITNPPYKFAQEFVEKSMELMQDGKKLAMFLKLTFLEGKRRREMFDRFPPKKVWVSSSRITCAKNADFDSMKALGGSAAAYAWFVWEKGYSGPTVVGWFN
jgi:hypothetical protein